MNVGRIAPADWVRGHSCLQPRAGAWLELSAARARLGGLPLARGAPFFSELLLGMVRVTTDGTTKAIS